MLSTTLRVQGRIRTLYARFSDSRAGSLSKIFRRAGLGLQGNSQILLFEPRHLDFGANQKSNVRDELNFAWSVHMGPHVLQVDHANEAIAAEDGDGQESFVTVLG